MSFQVYPGMYDDVMIVHKTRRTNIEFYVLDRIQTPSVSINAYDRDGIIIMVWSNGELYVGGIWQVRWSHENVQHFLQCTCATGIHLVKVANLLSTEELDFLENAISAAFDFWEKQFPDAIFEFISCEEVNGNMLEQHLRDATDGQFDVKREMTWRITLYRFIEEGPNPTISCAFVHYHPENQAEPFNVEII